MYIDDIEHRAIELLKSISHTESISTYTFNISESRIYSMLSEYEKIHSIGKIIYQGKSYELEEM